MNRLMTTIAAVVLAGGALLARAGAQGTAPPPTQKPTTPATQTPAAPTPKPASPAPAPQPPFPEGAKVAYVQLQGVVGGSKFGQCATQLLNDLRAKDQAAVAPKQKQVQDLQAQIQSQQGVLTQAAMTEKQRELQRLQLEGQALVQQLQTDEANKQQDMLNDFQAKVFPVLEALRKEKDLQFILSQDTNAILVANKALDLTTELIKRLDVAYPSCKSGGH